MGGESQNLVTLHREKKMKGKEREKEGNNQRNSEKRAVFFKVLLFWEMESVER
jgi:hypothetical protein